MRRRGYAKEAISAVIEWMFSNTPFNEAYSYMRKTNMPSVRTALSVGGRLAYEFEDDGNAVNQVYLITKAEWGKSGAK